MPFKNTKCRAWYTVLKEGLMPWFFYLSPRDLSEKRAEMHTEWLWLTSEYTGAQGELLLIWTAARKLSQWPCHSLKSLRCPVLQEYNHKYTHSFNRTLGCYIRGEENYSNYSKLMVGPLCPCFLMSSGRWYRVCVPHTADYRLNLSSISLGVYFVKSSQPITHNHCLG